MEKKRGGGGQPEAFDPNTGKYVADGQPNKYYDNPEEKGTNNYTKAPNGKSLTELFGDIFGEENEEINSMFGYTGEKKAETFEEKYSKPILEMSQEEHLKEIGEHKEYLIQKGIDLSGFRDAFNNDLQLKCANFRQMHKLMEKYPIELKGCKFVNSHAYSGESGSQAYMQYQTSYTKGFVPNTKMNFNAKYFLNYKNVAMDELDHARIKWHTDCSDELAVSYTFTHEYGHAVFNDIIGKLNLFPREVLDDMFNKNLSKIKITTNIYGQQLVEYRGKKYRYNRNNVDAITQRLVQQEMRKVIKKQAEKIFDETFVIFSEQNTNIDNKQQAFIEDISHYARKGGIYEWFAETYASLECGKPTKSALAFSEWLKRNGYVKGEQ